MNRIKKIIDYLKLRHRAKKADEYANIAFGMCFRIAPPSFFMLNDEETVRRELEKAECDALELIERKNKEIAVGIREDRAKRIKEKEAKRINAGKEQKQQGIEAETLALKGNRKPAADLEMLKICN